MNIQDRMFNGRTDPNDPLVKKSMDEQSKVIRELGELDAEMRRQMGW